MADHPQHHHHHHLHHHSRELHPHHHPNRPPLLLFLPLFLLLLGLLLFWPAWQHHPKGGSSSSSRDISSSSSRDISSSSSRSNSSSCSRCSGRVAAWPSHPGPGRPQQAPPWRPPSSGTRRRGDSCVLHGIPSTRARRKFQNVLVVAATSHGFFGQSDHWIDDPSAPSQSRFVEPTSSTCIFVAAAPFCAPSVPVHSWLWLHSEPSIHVDSRTPGELFASLLDFRMMLAEVVLTVPLCKFRHLPVVENGEVIAMLDITKCLYDAISRMEKAAEQGSAIAAAVEGVERQWGSKFSAPYAFIETLRERMFKPSLSTIITENSKYAVVSLSDPVYVATKRMKELSVNSVVILTGNKFQGILTSKDVLMRVVAQNLSPELTLVEKVMTPNPECATLDTTILDALHIMRYGKFLHLPVIDRDGHAVACLDVLQITHAAISTVDGAAGSVNDMANTMMQTFWDSALAIDPPDEEYDTHSELSTVMTSEYGEPGKSGYPPLLGNSFTFKFEDSKSRVHRFNCGTESLVELVSAVKQRLGLEGDRDTIQLLYEDDEGDKVLLATDTDLIGAVNHAKLAGWKVLRLHFDSSDTIKEATRPTSDLALDQRSGPLSLTTGVMASAVALTGIGVMVYLKRANV